MSSARMPVHAVGHYRAFLWNLFCPGRYASRVAAQRARDHVGSGVKCGGLTYIDNERRAAACQIGL